MPELIFWAVIVDGETDVVFLYEFLDARESFGRGIAGYDYGNGGALAVFEFGSDVGVFVFGEIDGAGGVKLDACGGVIGHRDCLLLRIAGEMVFYVFGVQREDIELLQKSDHLGAGEIPKGVAGYAETNRRIGGWHVLLS